MVFGLVFSAPMLWGGAVSLGLGAFALQRLYKQYQLSRARYGGGKERKVIQKSGLAPLAGQLAQIDKAQQDDKAAVASAEVAEIGLATESPEKTGSSSSDMAVKAAAAKGSIQALEEEEAAEALGAIEGRALSLIAGLRLIELAIDQYIGEESVDERSELAQLERIKALSEQLAGLSNVNHIDAKALEHIRAFVRSFIDQLKAEVGIKKSKEIHLRTLLQRLDEAQKEMAEVITEAVNETGVFSKLEKRARGDFRSELTALQGALKAKQRDLSAELRKGAGADSNLVATLRKEVALLGRQIQLAGRLQGQLANSYRLIDQSTSQCQQLLGKIRGQVRALARFESALKRNGQRIEKAIHSFDSSYELFAKEAMAAEQRGNVAAISLTLSRHIKRFIKDNAQLAIMRGGFDKDLKKVVSAGFEISLVVESYELVRTSVKDAEESIITGTQTMARLLQGILGEGEMAAIEEKVDQSLVDLKAQIEKSKQVEKQMRELVVSLKSQLSALNAKIDQLDEQDKRLLSFLQVSSDTLGKMMDAYISRKSAIDERFLSGGKTAEYMAQMRSYQQQAGKTMASARR